MLVTLREVLKDAQEKKYGVGLFNTVNLEMAKGVLAAAEELKSPVIIGTAEVLLPYASLEELAYFLVPMAKKASVPVVLHYDHGLTDKKIVEAMRLGFSSIMYDCSTDTYENNIARVAQMVKIADMFGASVEGELGHVGIAANEEDYKNADNFTPVDKAVEFIQRTGVDILAVSIGTAHGSYVSAPSLDLERLEKINEAVDTPLVLHGGTGVPQEQLKAAFARGINKLNYATGYKLKLYEVARQLMDSGEIRPRMSDLMLAMERPMHDFIREIMRLAWPK